MKILTLYDLEKCIGGFRSKKFNMVMGMIKKFHYRSVPEPSQRQPLVRDKREIQ